MSFIKNNLVAVLLVGSLLLCVTALALIAIVARPKIDSTPLPPPTRAAPSRGDAIAACMNFADRRWRIGIENFDRSDAAQVAHNANRWAVDFSWDQGSRRFSCVVDVLDNGDWQLVALARTN